MPAFARPQRVFTALYFTLPSKKKQKIYILCNITYTVALSIQEQERNPLNYSPCNSHSSAYPLYIPLLLLYQLHGYMQPAAFSQCLKRGTPGSERGATEQYTITPQFFLWFNRAAYCSVCTAGGGAQHYLLCPHLIFPHPTPTVWCG
jgi:hypothetical protein